MFDIVAVTEPALIDAVYEGVEIALQEDIAAILNTPKLHEWQLADFTTQQTLMQYLANAELRQHWAAGEQLTNTLYNLAVIDRLAAQYKNDIAQHLNPQTENIAPFYAMFEQAAKLTALNMALVSKIGYDVQGRQYAQHLRNIGIDMQHTPFAANDTGLCVSMQFKTGHLPKAMATRLSNFKTLSHCSAQDMQAICQQTRYLLIEGYLLGSEKEQAKQLLAIAQQTKQTQDLQIGLTLSAQKVAADMGVELVKQFDFVAANEEEFNALLGDECSFEQVQNALDPNRQKSIIYTRGKQGAILTRQHQTEIITAKALPPEAVIDVTGAGDAFLAGLLFGFLQNQPLRYCGEMASLVARQIVQTHGARLSFGI